jgi:hypothetical protein
MKCLASAFVLLAGLVGPASAVAPQPAPHGAYLVIELDRDTEGWAHSQALWNAVSAALARGPNPVAVTRLSGPLDDRVLVQLARAGDRDRALAVVARALRDGGERDAIISPMAAEHPDLISIRPDLAGTRARDDRLIGQLVESARAQLVAPDLGYVSVLRRPDDSIAITATGISDPTILRRVFQQDHVTLNLVDEAITRDDIEAGRIPEGDVIARPIAAIGDIRGGPLSVDRAPILSGEHFASFTPGRDQQIGVNVVSFRFDREGTRVFCESTTAHVGHRMAILISGGLVVAPVINEPICGGLGQISGSFEQVDIVAYTSHLSSGSLPAPIVVSGQGQGLTPAFDTFSARQISAIEKLGGRWGFVSASPEDNSDAQRFRGSGRICRGGRALLIHFNQNAPVGGGLEWRLSFDDDTRSQRVTDIDLDARELRAGDNDRAIVLRWEDRHLMLHLDSADLQFERCSY